MSERHYDDLPAATRRRMLLWALVRTALIMTSLLLLYYLLPLWDHHSRLTGVSLVLGLAVPGGLSVPGGPW